MFWEAESHYSNPATLENVQEGPFGFYCKQKGMFPSLMFPFFVFVSPASLTFPNDLCYPVTLSLKVLNSIIRSVFLMSDKV